MENLILIVQVLLWFLCPAIIGMILLQGGAGDISSAFGGGGQLDSTLGVGASKKMAKITGWLAAILFAFILLLAIPHKGSYGKALAPGGGASAGAVPAAMGPAEGQPQVSRPEPAAPVSVPAPVATAAPASTAAEAPASVPAPAATSSGQ